MLVPESAYALSYLVQIARFEIVLGINIST